MTIISITRWKLHRIYGQFNSISKFTAHNYYIQQIETHYVSYYGWGLTPISKFKVNCLTYIIARIQ